MPQIFTCPGRTITGQEAGLKGLDVPELLFDSFLNREGHSIDRDYREQCCVGRGLRVSASIA
jgi:hypothetical protein